MLAKSNSSALFHGILGESRGNIVYVLLLMQLTANALAYWPLQRNIVNT